LCDREGLRHEDAERGTAASGRVVARSCDGVQLCAGYRQALPSLAGAPGWAQRDAEASVPGKAQAGRLQNHRVIKVGKDL